MIWARRKGNLMFIDFRRDDETLRAGRHHVVIVGGGFGGTYAARALRFAPVNVTLIDRRNFHVFSPMLYQAATGGLAGPEIAQPLRGLLRKQRNTRVILGDAVGIDPGRHAVRLSDGTAIPYDTLVVATGTRHAYPSTKPHWRELAPGLTTLEDAAEIRRRVLLAFESAEREPDPARRRAWTTFIVVGGGPTGVELAGALAELARDTLRGEFRSLDPRESRVVLVEMSDRVLSEYPEKLSAAATRHLEQLGVVVRTGTTVSEIEESHVSVGMGSITERIDAHTVLWAAGTRPTAFGRRVANDLGATVDGTGRIVVDNDLSVPGHPDVLVIGDLAATRRRDGSAVPAVAQGAIQTGRHVGRVVEARRRGERVPAYRYRDLGELAMVGRFRTVARLPIVHFSGPIAWLLWLGIHIWYLQGLENRALVAVRWLRSILTGGRGSRLITGAHAAYGALPPIGQMPAVPPSGMAGGRRVGSAMRAAQRAG